MFDENSSMLINRWSRSIFFELLNFSAFYSDDSFFMPSWVAISGHHSGQNQIYLMTFYFYVKEKSFNNL